MDELILRSVVVGSGINVENPDRPSGPPGSGGIVKDILRKAAQCVNMSHLFYRLRLEI